MGRCSMRAVSFVALAMLGQYAGAFVLIDDFTVGDLQHVIEWPSNFWSHEEANLDTAHCRFGRRATDLAVMQNFFHLPISINIGGGQMQVSYATSSDMATDFRTVFGPSTGVFVDLSNESQIWVDLYTEDPSNRFADQWSITVTDADGHIRTNPGWHLRPGGVFFNKSGFGSGIDWIRVAYMNFRQIFSNNAGPVPQAYTVTKVYATGGPIEEVAPTSVSLVYGKFTNGSDPLRVAQADGNFLTICRFIVPNLSVAPVTVQLDGTLPFVPTALAFRSVCRMETGGAFSVTLDMWDWTTGQYDPLDTNSWTIGLNFNQFESAGSGELDRYVGQDRAVRGRIRVKQTGIVASLAWCVDLDQAVWEAAP